MKSALLLILVLSFSSLSFANINLSADEKRALTITSVEVYQIDAETAELDKGLVELPKIPPVTGTPLDEISIIIDSLIAIGKKIWPIIDAGRPVINNKLAPAVSIVPHLKNETGILYEMQNWSIPRSMTMKVSFKNGFNMEVVGFTYTLFFQYNGDYQGAGKYVSNLRVVASNIYTAWGFNFDAASELVGISNVGTSGEPIASGIINITYNVKGLLNENRSASTIYVDGLGRTQLLNN